ncbi:MAG: M23 family metallopeptidase [Ruminococcaceae bacterium]|nr:M23 family metallopeptidase [Oscillospiraceae bacterium]
MSDKKKQFLNRIADKGYYIALILCAAAIGISGYLYYRNASGDDPSLEDPNATVDVMNPNPTDTTPSTPAPTQPTEKKPLVTGRPVSGEVIMDYAMDCLCYNPTTRDWRTHDGMDFAAEAGAPVVAAADGTVYTIYEDESLGTTVVIRHEDGYVTTYSSLSADTKVKVGDTVKLGQTIGTVGTTALLETALGDHVHFAVTHNGKPVDPEIFFALS